MHDDEPHTAAGEFLIIFGIATVIGVAHVILHEGGLAAMLGPELMRPLLVEETAMEATARQKSLTQAQRADEKNKDISHWAHLQSNKSKGVNVKLHTTVQVPFARVCQGLAWGRRWPYS